MPTHSVVLELEHAVNALARQYQGLGGSAAKRRHKPILGTHPKRIASKAKAKQPSTRERDLAHAARGSDGEQAVA